MIRRVVLALSFSLGVLVACGPPKATTGDGGPDASPDVDATVGPDADQCTGGTLCGVPVSCCPAGNECVLDQCVPVCASGVYCGADLLTCCASGEVCLGAACVVPGTACADPYDCEPGQFCEPTLDQCLPQPDPLTCQLTPTFADLTVTLEHSYTAHQIISIPVVANLDGVGAPEIVVNLTQQDGRGFPGGRIAILDGATLTELVPPIPHDPANNTYGSHGRSTIAVGDVSGDGLPDMIYGGRTPTTGTANSRPQPDRGDRSHRRAAVDLAPARWHAVSDQDRERGDHARQLRRRSDGRDRDRRDPARSRRDGAVGPHRRRERRLLRLERRLPGRHLGRRRSRQRRRPRDRQRQARVEGGVERGDPGADPGHPVLDLRRR